MMHGIMHLNQRRRAGIRIDGAARLLAAFGVLRSRSLRMP